MENDWMPPSSRIFNGSIAPDKIEIVFRKKDYYVIDLRLSIHEITHTQMEDDRYYSDISR